MPSEGKIILVLRGEYVSIKTLPWAHAGRRGGEEARKFWTQLVQKGLLIKIGKRHYGNP